jgi:hypothetical protein
MSNTKPYEVVTEKDDREAYQVLPLQYLKWVHEPDCDTNYNKEVQVGNERRHVTFMRDDSIGDPKDPNNEKDNIQEISGPAGTDVFFPVYYFHSSIGESDGQKGECKTIADCIRAATHDLGKLLINEETGKQDIWAKISINDKNVPVDITSNFKDHTVTVPQLEITVGENRLNREPQFHLKPGPHQGVVIGTFMYLRNLKEGNYVFDFGGKASNFKTKSIYTVHIK